jgi:hypothetical protein
VNEHDRADVVLGQGASLRARRRRFASQRRAEDCPPHLLQQLFSPCVEFAPEVCKRQSAFVRVRP